MNSLEHVEQLEKLIGQLQGLHDEVTQLSRKAPNDGLNKFKLGFVNRVLLSGNSLLIGRYRPFEDFEQFDGDDLPTNSDVTMILAQYIEQAERLRSDNMVQGPLGNWFYEVNGSVSEIRGKAPTRVGAEKK